MPTQGVELVHGMVESIAHFHRTQIPVAHHLTATTVSVLHPASVQAATTVSVLHPASVQAAAHLGLAKQLRIRNLRS